MAQSRRRKARKSRRDRTVVLLGAGASAASQGLPCMEGFFECDNLLDAAFPTLRQVLEEQYGTGMTTDAGGQSKLNLEHVLSFLEMTMSHMAHAS